VISAVRSERPRSSPPRSAPRRSANRRRGARAAMRWSSASLPEPERPWTATSLPRGTPPRSPAPDSRGLRCRSPRVARSFSRRPRRREPPHGRRARDGGAPRRPGGLALVVSPACLPADARLVAGARADAPSRHMPTTRRGGPPRSTRR
jgi:hypothetical protein